MITYFNQTVSEMDIDRKYKMTLLGIVTALLQKHDEDVAQIVRCKDCKHWNLQVGNVKGDGLGSCDFHNVNLVTGEGFCYWADRRDEAE